LHGRARCDTRARTKSTLGRPGYGRVAFLSLCNLPGTQTARLGLVVRVTPPAAPQASTRNGVATRVSRHAQPLPASPRGANGGPVSSGPLWSFPQAAQRHKGGQNASAALHQSRPVGARLHGRTGTQHSKRPVRGAAARARSRSHRPLQLGSCYSTAAHRVAARTLSNRACAGLGGFPGAHCFTQAIAIL
jgi:hypothetical protein